MPPSDNRIAATCPYCRKQLNLIRGTSLAQVHLPTCQDLKAVIAATTAPPAPEAGQ